MKQVIDIEYKLDSNRKILFEVHYYYKQASDGDYYTPGTEAEVYLEKVIIDTIDILEILDDVVVNFIENRIHESHDS